MLNTPPPGFRIPSLPFGRRGSHFQLMQSPWAGLVRVIGIAQVSSCNEALSPRFCGKL